MIPGFGFLSKKKEKQLAAQAEAGQVVAPSPAPSPAPLEPTAEARINARSQPFLLNLGCGSCFHRDWVNLDFMSSSADVIPFDLRKPLPISDQSAAIVYHSHVLEHFRPEDARRFLKECHRVLKPGGMMRVAIPDLEMIARLYLQNLEQAANGDREAEHRHKWMTIELVDQLSREQSGGEMLKFWKQNPMPAEEFVVQRMGREVMRFLEYFRSTPQGPSTAPPQPEETAEKIGAFRLGGEVHKWMYDRVSLKSLLEEIGFEQVRPCRADESAIPEWNQYGLDLHSDGGIRKPDSLFMEGTKTAGS
ncbi:MAG: class I SAM-dependent methyltransferase [Verrucomicrobiales bacterium]